MCMGKHHTSACQGPTPQISDLQTTTPPSDPNHSPQTPKGESYSQVHASLVPINLANVPQIVAKSHSWKLSQPIVQYDNTHCAATLLFDGREQRSFMTQKVACYRQCCCYPRRGNSSTCPCTSFINQGQVNKGALYPSLLLTSLHLANNETLSITQGNSQSIVTITKGT